jgi:BASS family bile acid:Na+ symporter
MLAFLTGVAVPGLAFLIMLIVGLDLRIEDFQRISRYPRTVVIAIAGQIILLPILAIALIKVLKASDAISAGMLFLAFSPGGAISNYYTQLAGRNVALSVTLTAVNTAGSLISIPVCAVVFLGWIGVAGNRHDVPTNMILLQLSLFIILPIAVGMWLGKRFQYAVLAWGPALRLVSIVLVVALLSASIWAVRDEFLMNLPETFLFAFLFTIGAMLIGALIASVVSPVDRHVVVIESAVRNIPVAILVGSSMATHPMFVGFLASYFLIEFLIMISYALVVRNRSEGP